MSIGKKNDFERIEEREIIRVRNRHRLGKGKNIISNENIKRQEDSKIE